MQQATKQDTHIIKTLRQSSSITIQTTQRQIVDCSVGRINLNFQRSGILIDSVTFERTGAAHVTLVQWLKRGIFGRITIIDSGRIVQSISHAEMKQVADCDFGQIKQTKYKPSKKTFVCEKVQQLESGTGALKVALSGMTASSLTDPDFQGTISADFLNDTYHNTKDKDYANIKPIVREAEAASTVLSNIYIPFNLFGANTMMENDIWYQFEDLTLQFEILAASDFLQRTDAVQNSGISVVPAQLVAPTQTVALANVRFHLSVNDDAPTNMEMLVKDPYLQVINQNSFNYQTPPDSVSLYKYMAFHFFNDPQYTANAQIYRTHHFVPFGLSNGVAAGIFPAVSLPIYNIKQFTQGSDKILQNVSLKDNEYMLYLEKNGLEYPKFINNMNGVYLDNSYIDEKIGNTKKDPIYLLTDAPTQYFNLCVYAVNLKKLTQIAGQGIFIN